MPGELKKHVFSFIDGLKTTKKGHLYNKIMEHLENNKEEIKDPFTDESKTVVIHKNKDLEPCESCGA